LLKKCIRQLGEYFSGKRKKFDLRLTFSGSTFQRQVWNELMNIPYGNNINYLNLSNRIENVKVTHANHAFVGSGYKESVLENFVFTNCDITAGAIGLFEFTKDWKFNNVNISIDERDKISVDSNGKAQQERLKN